MRYSGRGWVWGLVVVLPWMQAVAGLTGQWKLDGDALDATGAHHGSVSGAVGYAAGQVVTAAVFNGVSDYLNLGADVLNTNAYTKAAWVFRTSNQNNNVISGDGGGSQHALYIPSSLGSVLCAGHNGAWSTVKDVAAIPTGVWTHVAVTYDASVSGGRLALYRNGQLAGGAQAVATNVARPNGGLCLIGAHNFGSLFGGRIDDAGVWDHALSAADIDQVYKAGLHRVDLGAATGFQYSVYGLVPEATNFDLVYEYVIPNQSALGASGLPVYLLDRSGNFTNDLSFDRVAYFLELYTNGAASSKWVYVSMEAFTKDARKIGVPANALGGQFQQLVNGMNVHAGGVTNVATGTNLASGNIEFWGINYAGANSLPVPNASSTNYDCGDQPSTSGYYGSMQIHNHAVNGTTNTQTIFAYNHWGAGGNSDLGIGNNTGNGNPDYTFMYNATGYTAKTLLVLARPAVLPAVVFTNRPVDLQLFPRDRVTGRATVRFDGAVLTTGCQQVAVNVLRLGAAYTSVVQALNYTDGAAPFAVEVPITAELADYDFSVVVSRDDVGFTVASARDVVAGDVLVINGQSNAEAAMRSGSANSNRHFYVRSFGYHSEGATNLVLSDGNWYQAEGDAAEGAGTVGQWGLRMGRLLMESNGIPVAVINGAKGGKPISYFLRNDSNPEDLGGNYGRLLHRLRKSGLQNAVRAILFYQGESDSGAGATHESGFINLYNNWLRDYPSVEKVYVCQLHMGCGVTQWNLDLRDRQRLFQDRFPRMRAISTTGVPQYTDNCHYAYTNGYRVLGENIARVLQRDLYGADLPSSVETPNVGFAYVADGLGLTVTLMTRNELDEMAFDPGAGADFRIEGLTSAVVTAGIALGNLIQLTFDRDVRGGTGISYGGHVGGAPYVTNQHGIGLLSFYNQPLNGGLVPPQQPSGLRAVAVASNRIDLGWVRQTNASHFLIRRDGVVIGTSHGSCYFDGAVANDVLYSYQIAAVNPLGTSAWSAAASASTSAENVFRSVPEARDYDVLYRLDLPADLNLANTLDAPYAIDRSALYTQGIRRVAYYLELQDLPGNPLRWAYASMDAFSTNARLLGVPVALKGAVLQMNVTNLNVFASTNSGVATGRHLAGGNIEFWGLNYAATNASGVPNARHDAYDSGDLPVASGYYGAMQIHNHAVNGTTNSQTILAYNRWGQAGNDDIGTGSFGAATNADWTFAANSLSWNLRRLLVLVLRDADDDGLPDAWEMRTTGALSATAASDTDGDGVCNGDELTAGTNPADGSDWPRALIDLPAAATRVSFSAAVDRVYAVDFATSLVDTAWFDTGLSVTGTGSTIHSTITNSQPAALFRLRITRP